MVMAMEELMGMAQLGGDAKVVIDLGYVYIHYSAFFYHN
jgi:ribosome-associated protein YbcJ (S4-like RNA binding protein)